MLILHSDEILKSRTRFFAYLTGAKIWPTMPDMKNVIIYSVFVLALKGYGSGSTLV